MCYTLGNTWSSRVNAIVLGAPRLSLDELANEAFGEFLSKVCYPSQIRIAIETSVRGLKRYA